MHHGVRPTTYLALALAVVGLSLSACDAEGSAAKHGHSAREAAAVEGLWSRRLWSGPRRPLSTSQGPTSWPA